MSWRNTALELLASSAFLMGDTTLVELVRTRLAVNRQPKKPAGFEWSPETKAAMEAADRQWMVARAMVEARKRGSGLPGLRKALKERGQDLC